MRDGRSTVVKRHARAIENLPTSQSTEAVPSVGSESTVSLMKGSCLRVPALLRYRGQSSFSSDFHSLNRVALPAVRFRLEAQKSLKEMEAGSYPERSLIVSCQKQLGKAFEALKGSQMPSAGP